MCQWQYAAMYAAMYPMVQQLTGWADVQCTELVTQSLFEDMQ